ncbi:guanylate cyclase 32E [Anthonomus grandis grandis]|uniref:guanylate cyclase 32E n=1 Tax=Anthonomus grandis grandis TaxID=2921223 RepID=UPI0021667612|nr:guanylate cyclase 32E [Anthonomus grandis grandis]
MLKFLLLIATLATRTNSDTFTLGYLTGSQRRPGDKEYSRPGLTISGAISLAVEEINAGLFGKRGHKLDFIIAETYGEEVVSVQKTADLWTRNVSAFIGPQETCEHEAFMAAAFNVPMISYFCTHSATSDKSKFPTFARTRPPDPQISKSVISVLNNFNWTHVVILYLKSPEYQFGNIAEILVDSLPKTGIEVFAIKYWTTPYHHGYMENPFAALVGETYRDTRIYVVLGHYYEHLGLMVAMEQKGLFQTGEYFVVGVDIEQYDQKNPSKYLRGLLRDSDLPNDLIAQRAYRNYIGIVPSSPIGFENFSNLVNEYMERPPFNYPNPLAFFGGVKTLISPKPLIRAEAAYLYDAVHLYSKALLKVMDNGGNPRNGTAIINAMKTTHYRSAMGYLVYMDENGDAEGNYTLIARKPLKYKNRDEFGLFPVGVFGLSGNKGLPIIHFTGTVDWVAGHPPIAVPSCGFRNEKCITYTVEITGGVAGGLILVTLLVSLVLYRNWRYEQELDSLLWKIDFKEIKFNEENGKNRNSQPFIRTSQVSLSSNPDADFRYTSIFTQIGIYKGRAFAVKKVHKKTIDITREMKKELKMMRDLRHDNLNAFIGACTDPPNICIVTEYCTRGSLKDVLENDDVKLDNMFVASLVGDILRGMIYLHDSPIRFHGGLHTGNCLIDSRWVVKLSDYGLREFKRGAGENCVNDPAKIRDKCYKMLYRAPELLRLQESLLTKDQPLGTQKGDVYSFGMILYEIQVRQGPWGEQGGLNPAEVLNRVVYCKDPKQPFRPPLDKLENTFVKECLKECWAEVPEDRPDFKSVRGKLRPLRKGMKPNIFDNMMAMMEKYANNLEMLVDERTDQLQEEKKKTDALLYEMLPKPVADQLKKGNKVEAESFELVTIYFSDIVGFTAMSAESTPLQVVNFLNDLYSCFDSIIENYDVYKVETIGDAYMVVSGLPIRTDHHQHAAEVATMSLHLLHEVKNFTIRHRPGHKLMLRIGIHSGPVCAGVVGHKMPRYCLFGDTVNTASRMESTGLPLKIHCSKTCKDLLTKMGGYHLVERGMVDMKGKGRQLTYWLIGEDAHFRKIRKELREIRRGRHMRTLTENGHYMITRSSLKSKHVRSPIPRCSSFESPKRLRFANGGEGEMGQYLEAIVDRSSPCREYLGSNLDALFVKPSSTSCPCIENLANCATSLTQSQLTVLTDDQKQCCHSVPTLPRCHLNVPGIIQTTLSAPVSPRKGEWGAECTPLLKITEAQDVETCV